MVRRLEKIYYISAILMVLIVIYGAAHDMFYMFMFIPVFILLAMIKNYTAEQRLRYAGLPATAKIVKYESFLNFDENLASSRRGDVKKEVLLVEFRTNLGVLIKGQPLQYDIDRPILEDTDFEYPHNEKYLASKNFNPVGRKLEIIYDRDKPSVFTVKDYLVDDAGITLMFIYGLSIIVIVLLGSVLAEYNIVDTIAKMFS